MGQTTEVAKELQRYHLDILGMIEVRRTGSRRLCIASGQTLLYSGSADGSANKSGIGFLISFGASKCLMQCEPVSDRITMAGFLAKFQIVTVVWCFFMNQADQTVKDEFYQQLQGVTDIVARIDIVYLIGDMNVKMGQGNLRDSVMDKEGAGTVNEKGEFYADL